jgi:hypothetical protein
LEADYQGEVVFFIESTRQNSAALPLTVGRRHIKCSPFQQGYGHFAKVQVDEDLTVLKSFSVEVVPMSTGVNV